MARIAPTAVKLNAPKTAETLPRLKPSAPFKFIYHSTRWGWHPTRQRWFPMLGQQAIDPGVGGVDEHGRTALADVGLKERGWLVLPVETDEYLAAFAVQGGSPEHPKLRHVTKWQSVVTAGTRVIEECDEDGYYEWIDSLIKRGILPAEPEDHVKDMVLGKAREVASGEADRAKSKPSATRVSEVLTNVVADIEKAAGSAPKADTKGKPVKLAKTEAPNG
ncbi:MAG: hypothetical protein Q8P18_18335 [Pseudomonadota bacterium]|nr:hypothetical protein [Pseudomonadota bacterium]